MTYHLVRRQVIPAALGEVFAFFCDPHNLETLTPPWLGFRIIEATDRPIQLGTRIRYRLRVRGIPLRWESRIAEFAPGEHFADEQVRGPYAYWYHRHQFETVPEGVAISDEVAYRLPLGPLGRAAHALVVRRDLDRIFTFRHTRVAERFSQ